MTTLTQLNIAMKNRYLFYIKVVLETRKYKDISYFLKMTVNLDFDYKILFNKLNNYFFNNVKLSLKTPNKIFIITKTDVFYEINIYDESFQSFILCDDDSFIESMIVKQLSGKNIIDMSYGFCHYIAWNDKSEIYCWGNNGCGQFGNGKRDDENTTLDLINDLRNNYVNVDLSRFYGEHKNAPQLNRILSNLNIDVVKCGFWHSLALTENGEVYAWGLISTGVSIEQMTQSTPIKVDCFDGERVVMISCGYKHSLALTESGRVFSWGENSHGQLGTNNEIYRDKPKPIEIQNVTFKKISCGQRHSLLLSNEGEIYAFGDNKFGQIGSGAKEMQTKPVKLTYRKKFTDIASNFIEDISVAQSIDNNFYVWGKCGKEIHRTPLSTKFKSFDEVFSNFSSIQYKLSNSSSKDLLFRDGYFQSEFRLIGKELGHGSFGNVFRVKDSNGNHFAIKKVKAFNGYEEDFVREYIKNSHIVSLKNDLFVRQFHSWFEINSKELFLYIKMELCDKTLNEVMNEIHSEFYRKENNMLSPIGYYLASDIFIEILRGVLCLHEHKIIHKELNLSNILLKKEENGEILVKIADIGQSDLHQFSEQSHKQDRRKYEFIAPEVIKCNTYDTKADIYSLGIILQKLFKIDPTKY